MNAKLLTYIRGTLQGLIADFQNNPFRYYYESDVQADLYCRLANPWPMQKVVGGFPNDDKKIADRIRDHETSPFKREYPSPAKNQESKRFDIAFVDFSNSMDKNLYTLPVQVAIEIKLCKPGDADPFYRKKDDKDKLEDYYQQASQQNFLGLGLWLFQEPTKFKLMFENNNFPDWWRVIGNQAASTWPDSLSDSGVYFLVVPPDKTTLPELKTLP